MFKRLALIAVSTVLFSFTVSQAHADLLPGLTKPNFASFPQCDDPGVTGKIIKRFNWAEKHTWQRGFTLDEITSTRERVTHSETINAHIDEEEPLVARRYCRGHAQLSDGRHPTVLYLIEGGQGFAGTSYNVEFCINGLDPWRVYDGHCRTINF